MPANGIKIFWTSGKWYRSEWNRMLRKTQTWVSQARPQTWAARRQRLAELTFGFNRYFFRSSSKASTWGSFESKNFNGKVLLVILQPITAGGGWINSDQLKHHNANKCVDWIQMVVVQCSTKWQTAFNYQHGCYTLFQAFSLLGSSPNKLSSRHWMRWSNLSQ